MKVRTSSRAIALTIALLASIPAPLKADASPASPAPSPTGPSDSTVVCNIKTQDGKIVKRITNADVKSKLSMFPAGIAPDISAAPYEKIFPTFRDIASKEQNILYHADMADIEKDPKYAQMVEESKKGVKIKLFLDKKAAEKMTPEELRKAYEEIKKAAPKEDEYNISMITVTDKNKATDLLKQAQKAIATAPSKFAELANKESMNKIPDGNLGFVRLGELPEAFRDAIKDVKPVVVIPKVIPITMPNPEEPNKKITSYNIVMVQDKRQAKFPEFEAVQNELKAALIGKFTKEVVKELESKMKFEFFDQDGKPIEQKENTAAPATDAPKAAPAA